MSQGTMNGILIVIIISLLGLFGFFSAAQVIVCLFVLVFGLLFGHSHGFRSGQKS